MLYEMDNNGGNFVVRLHEDLSFDDHEKFREVLKHLKVSNCRNCVFDLSGLESVDSAGLGMLMIAYQDSQKNAWDFSLKAPQGQVRRLLEITDLGKVIRIQ